MNNINELMNRDYSLKLWHLLLSAAVPALSGFAALILMYSDLKHTKTELTEFKVLSARELAEFRAASNVHLASINEDLKDLRSTRFTDKQGDAVVGRVTMSEREIAVMKTEVAALRATLDKIDRQTEQILKVVGRTP